MSDLAYGDILSGRTGEKPWVLMVLAPARPHHKQTWDTLVLRDDDGYWKTGDIVDIAESTALDFRLTPD